MTSQPRVFISFDFDNDKDIKEMFTGQAKCSKTPFDIADWSCKAELAQSTWESQIKNKINKCNMVIVLVGKHAYNAIGVRKEVDMAVSQNVPVYGVRIKDTNQYTSLPAGLSSGKVYNWTWDNVSTIIGRAMSEGKNR